MKRRSKFNEQEEEEEDVFTFVKKNKRKEEMRKKINLHSLRIVAIFGKSNLFLYLLEKTFTEKKILELQKSLLSILENYSNSCSHLSSSSPSSSSSSSLHEAKESKESKPSPKREEESHPHSSSSSSLPQSSLHPLPSFISSSSSQNQGNFNEKRRNNNSYLSSLSSLFSFSKREREEEEEDISYECESLVLLWFLLEHNKSFCDALSSSHSSSFAVALVNILFYNRKSNAKKGKYSIYLATFLLTTLTDRRSFSLSLNSPLSSSPPSSLSPFFSKGTAADLMIVTFYRVLIDGAKELKSLWLNFFAILVNSSPFLHDLNSVSSRVLILLLKQIYSSPSFPSSSYLHNCISLLLESINNLLQYQYERNAPLVYEILTQKEFFEKMEIEVKEREKEKEKKNEKKKREKMMSVGFVSLLSREEGMKLEEKIRERKVIKSATSSLNSFSKSNEEREKEYDFEKRKMIEDFENDTLSSDISDESENDEKEEDVELFEDEDRSDNEDEDLDLEIQNVLKSRREEKERKAKLHSDILMPTSSSSSSSPFPLESPSPSQSSCSLPLSPILSLLQYMFPLILSSCQRRGDEESIMAFISKTTLVGVLPGDKMRTREKQNGT